MGSATIQGPLWSASAEDWAGIQEATALDVYRAVLPRLNLSGADVLLDVGCGSGVFVGLAAATGARTSGVDAAPALIAIARKRVPAGDFQVGEMESLDFGDDQFTVVTGFNSFQYATAPAVALGEARRVLRPRGQLVVMAWGNPERCEAVAQLKAVGSLLPPPPPGAPGPFALSAPGALEALVTEAGFQPRSAEEVMADWTYPDEATALRGLLSSGPAIRAIQHTSREAVRAASATAIAPFRRQDGTYLLRNAFRYVVATK